MTAAAADIFPGPLEEQLQRRLELTVRHAGEALGMPVAPQAGSELTSLRALIDSITGSLSATGSHDAAELCAEHAAALDRLRQRFEARFEALARVHAAVGELRKLTSPTEMLALGPASLCHGAPRLPSRRYALTRHGSSIR